MRVLITGATGLVGRNLLERLEQNDSISTIIAVGGSRRPEVSRKTLGFRGDLKDDQFCNYISENVDVAFHCAAASFGAKEMAENPLGLVTPNVIMNAQLMEQCYLNGVKKFIWLASTTGYPEMTEPVREEEMFNGDPHDKYFGVGWAKRYTEKLCELYSTKLKYPMTCVVLRPSNIYGPHDKYDFDKCHVLPALIRRFAEEQNPLDLWGDGSETRDFIYVDDMVDALVKTMELEEFTQLNIGSGTQFSILETIKLLMHITGHKPNINSIVNKPSMIGARRVDISKAEKVLGFYPKTTLKDGLTQTLEWYRRTYEA